MTYKEALDLLRKAGGSYYTRTGESMMAKMEWHGDLVRIAHEDGTTLMFKDAALVHLDSKWLGVVTEHFGYYVFDYDDLLYFEHFKRNYEDPVSVQDLM